MFTQNVNVARFARNVELNETFLWFSISVTPPNHFLIVILLLEWQRSNACCHLCRVEKTRVIISLRGLQQQFLSLQPVISLVIGFLEGNELHLTFQRPFRKPTFKVYFFNWNTFIISFLLFIKMDREKKTSHHYQLSKMLLKKLYQKNHVNIETWNSVCGYFWVTTEWPEKKVLKGKRIRADTLFISPVPNIRFLFFKVAYYHHYRPSSYYHSFQRSILISICGYWKRRLFFNWPTFVTRCCCQKTGAHF